MEIKIMKTYSQLKTEHRDELNNFAGIFFAFDNKQFAEGMIKVGLKPEETGKIFKLAAGGFILKDRSKAFSDMLKRHDNEMKELRKNNKELKKALVYELRNHEYCITYDTKPALDALGLTKNDIPKGMLTRACKESLIGCNV